MTPLWLTPFTALGIQMHHLTAACWKLKESAHLNSGLGISVHQSRGCCTKAPPRSASAMLSKGGWHQRTPPQRLGRWNGIAFYLSLTGQPYRVRVCVTIKTSVHSYDVLHCNPAWYKAASSLKLSKAAASFVQVENSSRPVGRCSERKQV